MSIKIAVEPPIKFYNNINGRNFVKKYSAPLHVLTHHIQYIDSYVSILFYIFNINFTERF